MRLLEEVKGGKVFYDSNADTYLRLVEDPERGDYYPALLFCERNSDIPFKTQFIANENELSGFNFKEV